MSSEPDRKRIIHEAMIQLQKDGERITGLRVCQSTGITNNSSVCSYLRRLEQEGHVIREGRLKHTHWIVITDPDGKPIPKDDPDKDVILEHRAGFPVPIKICPKRHCRGYEPINMKGIY